MTRRHFFTQFHDHPYFTKQAIKIEASRLGVEANTLKSHIQRSLSDGSLIRLKRGNYVSRAYFELNQNKLSYLLITSNGLLIPSYVSLETALQYYGILAEANLSVTTAITTMTPRKFVNRLGIFTYKHVKPSLFTGFSVEQIEGEDCLIAYPHKAVFDYLYFRVAKQLLREKGNIFPLMEEFRLDADVLSSKEKQKLLVLIERW